MKYASIDIETTGLDPKADQVLEIGCVIDDTAHPEVPVDKLPSFRAILVHKKLSGNPIALSMNADLINQISSKMKETTFTPPFYHPDAAIASLNDFLRVHFPVGRPVMGGKNIAGFDIPFLTNLGMTYPLQRVVDPCTLYIKNEDTVPPDLKTCIQRAGLTYDQSQHHTAVWDAIMIVELVRVGLKKLSN